jgi:NCAIR mutase (PurE)-related protein
MSGRESVGFEDLGFARVDYDRPRRRGYPEAIFCPGKNVDQILGIADSLMRSGAKNILATRASPEILEALAGAFSDTLVVSQAHLCILNPQFASGVGSVAVMARRPEDIAVSEEAAFTAEAMGSCVTRRFDAPLGSVEALPEWVASLASPNVVVAVDGQGGALPSVIAGLTSSLVVAIPTSAGSQLRGIPSLLAMLNTCVPGVVTVNIDNGFGGGYAAHVINTTAESETEKDGRELAGAIEGGGVCA